MEKYDLRDNLVGEYDGYRVYRNADGFLEGYKGIGESKIKPGSHSDVKRIVSNATTMIGFEAYVRGLRSRTAAKDKPVPISKLPQLPFND